MLVEGPGGFPAFPRGWVGIYCFRNKINNKVYIGKSVDLRARFLAHMHCAKVRKNRVLYDAMNKYGIDIFDFELIDLCPIGDGDKFESKWIEHYGSDQRTNGYNMTAGGGAGDTFSANPRREEIRLKYKARTWAPGRRELFSAKTKGRPRISPSQETRHKIADTLRASGCHPPPHRMLGIDHPMFGKTHTEAVRTRISESSQRSWDVRLGFENAERRRKLLRDRSFGQKNHNYADVPEIKLLQFLIDDPGMVARKLCAIFGVSKPTMGKRLRAIFMCENVQHFRSTRSHECIRSICMERLNAKIIPSP